MGIMSDLFFGQTPKPKVTKIEWEKIRGNLIGAHNFTTKEANEVEKIFRGDLYEEKDKDNGIDTDELIKGISYMRAHINLHRISPRKIDILEKELMEKITKY